MAIARALAQKPDVFLLDEPMSALDAQLREAMQVELRLLQQKLNITTIVVTHDQRLKDRYPTCVTLEPRKA